MKEKSVASGIGEHRRLCRAIFIYYNLTSLALAAFAIESDKLAVAFDYDKYFTLTVFLPYALLIFAYLIVFLMGYKNKKNNMEGMINNVEKSLRIKNKNIIFLFIFLQIFIVLYYLFRIYYFLSSESYRVLDDGRFLGGKEAYVLLMLQSVMPVIFWKHYVLRVGSILICALLGFAFSWLDASRASVIPLMAILLIASFKNYKILFVFALILQIIFYLLSIVGRTFDDRVTLDFLVSIALLFWENGFEFLLNSVSYFTAFSVLHFSYVVDTGVGVFKFFDLIYSLVPLPTIFWPLQFDIDMWRVDQFRPMGAVAEMHRVNPLFAFAYFFIFGDIARRIDCTRNQTVRVFQILLFSLSCVLVYQYSLRTVQWYLYAIVLINILYIKTNKSRTHFS
jgi:hypothetical protein